MSKSDLPIFILLTEFLKWLFARTESFPKSARFTFADRINNLGLDLFEMIIEARFSRNKELTLRGANLKLEKMRLLLRLSFEQRFLSLKQLEFGASKINEIGRMLGGWEKYAKQNYTESL